MESKNTILIVDDEQVGRDTLEALLFAQDYNLIIAGNGFEALAKAAQFKPDVILLDVMMPGMDGFEVCRRLRADPLLAEVPIIMVTALDDQDSRLRGLEAGADDFISKPFNRMELRARIHTITRLNRYRRLLLERTKFEWVVDQADDGYIILNADDEILYANSQARLYLSLPSNGPEPMTEKFLAVAQKHYQCEPQDAWANWPAQSAKPLLRYLVQPSSPNSATFWLQVDLMEMKAETNERHLIRLRDVTANIVERRARWAFHAQVSHKLRTPLALFDGFLDFLLEEDAYLSAAQRESLRAKIRKSVGELKKNIQDILQYISMRDIAGFGQEKCKLDEIPKIVAKVSHNLGLDSFKVIYPEAENSLVSPCLPLSGHALQLVLGELVENAQKFHPQQSPALEIKISEQADNICIQVADDGVTLSSEQLSKIWTPYYQAEHGFTGQVPGMGLGLSMVASLIWSAGGTCRAYNRIEGTGMVVELTLPLVQDKVTTP